MVGLDGHPDDMDPLLAHMGRVGEVERFHRMVVPAEQCGWSSSGPETRVATPLDLPALEALFSDYEVQFVKGARSKLRYLQRCISNHGAIVHTSGASIDGAVLTGGLTPAYLVFDHLRVAPRSRGRGISWALVSRVVEIAQAYGVGMLGSIVQGNPMSMPEGQGSMETQVSANLRFPDRFPGERRSRRFTTKVTRRLLG